MCGQRIGISTVCRRRRCNVQFFTMAWWCGTQNGDTGDSLAAYAAHVAAVRQHLPPDLLATEENVSLHDTRLRELRFTNSTLTLWLDSYSGEERLTLIYDGVERFESTADPEVGLNGPAGFGDLGYCEVDALPDGTFEHRMLFSTGIELVVVFRWFRLHRASHAHPQASGAETQPESNQ